MSKTRQKSKAPIKPDWALMVSDLRARLKLTQTEFGDDLRSSAMAVSRWERGAQEPPARSYIDLGNLAGDPDCWFYWSRAGLHREDLMRVLPRLKAWEPEIYPLQIVRAGASSKRSPTSQLVAVPLLKVVAASHGEKGDSVSILHDAPVETMFAAPKVWCPNPSSTNCLRVRGNSMAPLIHDGYILAVDTSQNERAKLDGKIVIAWNNEVGLTVSRYRRYDHTEVLLPENQQYESITMARKSKWKILAKVLWWIAKAP